MSQKNDRCVYRKDYQVPAYLVDTVELELDLFAREHAEVLCRLVVRRNAECDGDKKLFLHGEAIEALLSVTLDGVALDAAQYSCSDKGLMINTLPENFVLETRVRINPKANTALSGLYVDGGGMFCSQMEAEGFRRFTYFPDRPDVQSVWSCTIRADKSLYPVLLSNGNLVASGDLDNGRHFASWHDPFRKPCYLFALVAGKLDVLKDSFRTMSGRTVDLFIYTQTENLPKVSWAMDVLKRSMRWDEKTFGREYDLDRFMIVATDYFNFGAMENKGLNIFNASALLASPDTSTDARYFRIETVVAHEYFHNWSGNRVTCRSWFELSLKEGFTVLRDQLFSADMHQSDVERIEQATTLRAVQFPQDAGPMAHPIRPESYEAIDNFYTVTVYEKGAEVIRMMRTMTGPERFRKGTDLYFARHDGQSATCENFITAIEAGAGLDLAQFRRWYEQAGTPRVQVKRHYDREHNAMVLDISQSCSPSPGQPVKLPFHIPMVTGFLVPDGRKPGLWKEGNISRVDGAVFDPERRVLHLTELNHRVTFHGIPEAAIPSLFRGFSAPVIIEMPDMSDAERATLAIYDTDGFNRREALQDLALSVLQQLVAAGSKAFAAKSSLEDAFATINTAPWIDAVKQLVTQTMAGNIAPKLAAVSIGLPAESYLLELVPAPVCLEAIQLSTEYLLQECARTIDWKAVYRHFVPSEVYKPDSVQAGVRRMRNIAMRMLARNGDASPAIVMAAGATNMTDRADALAALCDLVGGKETATALATYRNRYHTDALMMDSWFVMQSSSRLAGGLQRLEKLLCDPAFNWKRPNSIRALAGGFAKSGIENFDKLDGSGYNAYADIIAKLDETNPSTAGRMAGVYNIWPKYDARRQALMVQALERIVTKRGPAISANLAEIVNKALAAKTNM